MVELRLVYIFFFSENKAIAGRSELVIGQGNFVRFMETYTFYQGRAS